MTYTKKQFLEDVEKEARALKKNATKEELSKLDFKTFSPQYPDRCVYGQMTGDCFSKRAHRLIKDCCIRLVDNEKFSPLFKPETIYNAVNGKPTSVKKLNEARSPEIKWTPAYISALEGYIMLPWAKNANLIAFLKGERKDLVL